MKTILSATAILLTATIASAVCLNGNPSVIEEFADSESVFIGKVLADKNVPESDNYYDGNKYSVETQEIFKGNPLKTIEIFSENSSGRFPMTVGSTYIIFLHYEFGRYQINNCGNSGLLSEKQEAVQTLRRLKKNTNETNK